jgi:aryl-alcohol dehydrogenase-like predicted oxidoreductase
VVVVSAPVTPLLQPAQGAERRRAENPCVKYRTYPGTEIEVSEVGFGLWTTATTWWGTMTDDEAVAMLHEANDLGITLFDAADTYGNGRSEEQLAKAFAGRRDRVVYSTKFGYDFYNYAGDRKGQNEIPQDFSPAYVRFALEQSLRRLGTDVIDLYSLHNARLGDVRNDELFALLEALRAEGKIRAYGVALGPAIGWLVEGVEAVRRPNVTNLQMIYNMLEPFPGDEMVRAAVAASSSTGFQIRVPHSSGMLEGKYTAETTFPPGDHRNHRPRSWLLNGVKKIETLRFLEQAGRTLGQAAIQWLLAEPRVMTVLPNVYDLAQLREFAAAPAAPALTAAELARIAELSATNFGVEEAPMRYKGTMSLEAVATEPASARS